MAAVERLLSDSANGSQRIERWQLGDLPLSGAQLWTNALLAFAIRNPRGNALVIANA